MHRSDMRPPDRPLWQVEITPHAERWFMKLGQDDAERIGKAMDELAEHGPTLGRAAVESIKTSRFHNMKELRSRSGHLRVLFAFDPNRHAVLLVGGDKTGDWDGWYKRNIPVADRLYAQHLRDLGKGEQWAARTRAGERSAGRDR